MSIELDTNPYFYSWYGIIVLLHMWTGCGYEIDKYVASVRFYR